MFQLVKWTTIIFDCQKLIKEKRSAEQDQTARMCRLMLLCTGRKLDLWPLMIR